MEKLTFGVGIFLHLPLINNGHKVDNLWAKTVIKIF
jgi:hypothetical protein